MSTRQVYLNFQDGNGFINVSDLVKYNTLTYTQRAFNDTYHYAQNECSFDIIYDSVIFPKLRYVTDDILVRIVDLNDTVSISAENDVLLTTENGFYICAETNIAIPVFYGHIPPSRSRTYDGILENTIFTLEAIDELDWMDVEVGDISYTNCKVYDPSDPTNSIVHKLALIAGWDSSKLVNDKFITTVIAKFAPTDTTNSVLETLDTLLYEYGYTLNLNTLGYIDPIKWNVSSDQVSSFTFDETNMIKEVSVTDEVRNYDSAKVTYYELGFAEKVRLFTDDNCGYNDDGTFAGYAILNGYYYPPAANATDETTGTNQIVYQEYTDDAIKYWTNKAIKENLDYSYKAFSSDFSSMVATENHFIDRIVDSGVTVVSETFYNKKCRLLLQNTSGSTKTLYANNVYGDVWYKSSERTSTVSNVDTPVKQYTYTMSYVYSKTIADAFVKALAAQYKIGKTVYKIISDYDHPIGSYVTVTMGDGTDQTCIIRERSFDESTEQYSYICIACSVDRGSLTSQTSTISVSVETASPYDYYVSVGQINIPYSGSTPDFTRAYTDFIIKQNGIDVSAYWNFSASVSGVTGAFDSVTINRYKISGISVLSGSVTITASRSGWSDLVSTVAVIKAIGEKGDDGTSVTLKGSVTDYTYLPSSGQTEGDLYIVLNAGGGFDAGDGAVWNGSSWANAGPIQGPAGTSQYLHIRYSAYADGTSFSTSVNTYIGTAVTTSAVAPTDKGSYTWSKFIGQDGTNGANAIVMTSPTTPSGTYVGQMGIYNSRIYQWNGSAWVINSIQPMYLGIGILAGSSSASFNGATVNTDGVITTGSTVTAKIYDWMINYSATNVAIGLYYWSGSAWVASMSVAYLDSCTTDLFNLKTGGIEVSGYTTIINAVIKNLMVSQLKLLTGGKLYSGNGNYANADTPSYLSSDGEFSLGDQLAFSDSQLKLRASLTNGDRYGIDNTSTHDTGEPGLFIYEGTLRSDLIYGFSGPVASYYGYGLASIPASVSISGLANQYIRMCICGDYIIVAINSTTLQAYKYVFGSFSLLYSYTISAGTAYRFDISSYSSSEFIMLNGTTIQRYSVSDTAITPINTAFTIPSASNMVALYDYFGLHVAILTGSGSSTVIYIYLWDTVNSTFVQETSFSGSYDYGYLTQGFQIGAFTKTTSPAYRYITFIIGESHVMYDTTNKQLIACTSAQYVPDKCQINLDYNGRCFYQNNGFIINVDNIQSLIKTGRGYARERCAVTGYNGVFTVNANYPVRCGIYSTNLLCVIGATYGGMKMFSLLPNI
jgi:hypothetical protein